MGHSLGLQHSKEVRRYSNTNISAFIVPKRKTWMKREIYYFLQSLLSVVVYPRLTKTHLQNLVPNYCRLKETYQ